PTWWRASTTSPSVTASASRPSGTPVTATCTPRRCWTRPTATPRSGPKPPSARSSPRRSSSAAPSPVSTAWEPRSCRGCRTVSALSRWRCCRASRPPSTRRESSTRARPGHESSEARVREGDEDVSELPIVPQVPRPVDAGDHGVHRRGIFDPELLDRCISCGFCLPVCPTYALDKDEQSSPRGRITLMRALESGRLEPDDPTLQHEASYCLGCRACETVCPAGVEYGPMLEQWRDHHWRAGHGPALARWLRWAVARRRMLQLSGLVRRFARTRGPVRDDVAHVMLGCAERALFPAVSQAARALVPGADAP